MKDVLKLQERNGYVKIELLRELTTDDLRVVNETPNSINFIFSLANETYWEFTTKEKQIEATLKIRLLFAPDLEKELSEMTGFAKDNTVTMYLMDLRKVHKKTFTAKLSYAGCRTPEQREERKDKIKEALKQEANNSEQSFYKDTLNIILNSINQINEIYTGKNLLG